MYGPRVMKSYIVLLIIIYSVYAKSIHEGNENNENRQSRKIGELPCGCKDGSVGNEEENNKPSILQLAFSYAKNSLNTVKDKITGYYRKFCSEPKEEEDDDSGKRPVSFDPIEPQNPIPKVPPIDHGSTQAGLNNTDIDKKDSYINQSLKKDKVKKTKRSVPDEPFKVIENSEGPTNEEDSNKNDSYVEKFSSYIKNGHNSVKDSLQNMDFPTLLVEPDFDMYYDSNSVSTVTVEEHVPIPETLRVERSKSQARLNRTNTVDTKDRSVKDDKIDVIVESVKPRETKRLLGSSFIRYDHNHTRFNGSYGTNRPYRKYYNNRHTLLNEKDSKETTQKVSSNGHGISLVGLNDSNKKKNQDTLLAEVDVNNTNHTSRPIVEHKYKDTVPNVSPVEPGISLVGFSDTNSKENPEMEHNNTTQNVVVEETDLNEDDNGKIHIPCDVIVLEEIPKARPLEYGSTQAGHKGTNLDDINNDGKRPVYFDVIEPQEKVPKAPPVEHGSFQAGHKCSNVDDIGDDIDDDGIRSISFDVIEPQEVPKAPPVEHGSFQAGHKCTNVDNIGDNIDDDGKRSICFDVIEPQGEVLKAPPVEHGSFQAGHKCTNVDDIGDNIDDDGKRSISFDVIEPQGEVLKAPPVEHGSSQAGHKCTNNDDIDVNTDDGKRPVSFDPIELECPVLKAPPVEHGSYQEGLNSTNFIGRVDEKGNMGHGIATEGTGASFEAINPKEPDETSVEQVTSRVKTTTAVLATKMSYDEFLLQIKKLLEEKKKDRQLDIKL